MSPESVWEGPDRHPGRTNDWGLSSGFNLMRSGDAIWLYAAGRQHLRPRTSGKDLVRGRLLECGTQLGHPVRAGATECPPGRSTNPGRPGGVADIPEDRVTRPDDPDGPLSDRDARTRVLRQIAERRGQVTFRRQLLAAYDGQCAVTGESAAQVLEAAHIKLYRGEQTNVVRNGLLLLAERLRRLATGSTVPDR